jgi:pimeloyl-ACP methyl ester carboxylesterase
MTKLIVLHGYTMNAAVMRRHMGGLVERLEHEVELEFIDAPHPCSEDTVNWLYSIWKTARLAPPHYKWFESVDDGREYQGWEQTRERVQNAMAGGNVGFLGFSQGAIVSTALAALAEHGQAPPVQSVILIAGRAPRSEILKPLLQKPLRTPSLHVWGTADTMAATTAEELSTRFDPKTREVVVWNGDHRVPTRGEAADAIVEFVKKQLG